MRKKSHVQFYVNLVLTSCGGSTSTTPPVAVHPNLGGSKKARFISVSKNTLSSCCGGAAFDASMAALLLFIFSFVPLPPRRGIFSPDGFLSRQKQRTLITPLCQLMG